MLPVSLRHEAAMSWLAGLDPHMLSQSAVVLDASQLSSFDSSALACCLEVHRRVQAAGGKLVLQGMPKPLQRLSQVYGLSELLVQQN